MCSLLKIDSIKLNNLEVISEVNLINSSTKPAVKNSAVHNNFAKLQDIKQEINEEVDEYLNFQSSLEVECNMCRETFQSEEDLMRHYDYVHQVSGDSKPYKDE